jgi:RNA polymerase sigma factor (sigma-70 family)
MAASDHDLVSLIARSRDESATVADRHEAFGRIVRRFQDLALACAYARLRDRALAEDAAQDAFVVAWERLGQLRDPEAFPGWIRRLVLTQCHRRLRCARLASVPQDEARAVAAAPDPAMDIDAIHDSAIVRRALAQLAAVDRLVLSLFYGSERSHKEIAGWLGVPVTTVARRLAHAKRRLQKHALDALSGELRAQGRRAGEAFLVELSARLRRADADDTAAIMNLASRLDVEGAREIPASAPACAYVVEDPASHAPTAYAAAWPTIFKPIYELRLALGEGAIRRHAGDVLLMQVVEDLTAQGAICVRHRTSARHRALVDLLESRGFEMIRRAQDWRLDTATATRRAAGASARSDLEFRSLGEAAEDPALFDGALELVTSAIADDPAARPFLPIHPDTLRRSLRAQRDGIIAIAAGTIHGLIGASADEAVPEGCRLNLLVVARPRRRQGLATALLDRLLAHRPGAAARLVAPARPDLTGWLSRCGFLHTTDWLLLERLLRTTVRVAPERLDDYVGRYVVDALPLAPITIERHGDFLVSKARDMRDVLLASSECEFFTRHHYGEGRFERDENGRVVRLVYVEGSHEFVAVRSDPPMPPPGDRRSA